MPLRPPRDVVVYANRFPRLYRVPTIVAIARGYRRRGLRFILAVDREQTEVTPLDYLRARVEVQEFRSLTARAVQGYRSRWFNVLFAPGFFFRCIALRPRVVIQEGVGGWGVMTPLLKLLFGTQIVVSFERTETSEIRASVIKTVYQRLYFRWFVDKVVANGSRTVRLLTVRLGYRGPISVGNVLAYVPRRTRVAAISSLSLREREQRAQGAVVRVLVVMAMIQRKGVDRLLPIVEATASDLRVRWTIIGSGDQSAAVATVAAACPNVEYIPAVRPEVVYDYYRASDYLVLPTREDNWSLVVHEAMACGVVPITTIENGVVPDLVNSLSGHVLDFDSPTVVDEVRAILGRGPVHPDVRAAQEHRARRIGTHLRVGSSFVLPVESAKAAARVRRSGR